MQTNPAIEQNKNTKLSESTGYIESKAWCGVELCVCTLCVYSVGFFGPWHREEVNEAKFNRRGSLNSLVDAVDNDVDDDNKSVASMHELYTSSSKPEVSKFASKLSIYSTAWDYVLFYALWVCCVLSAVVVWFIICSDVTKLVKLSKFVECKCEWRHLLYQLEC